MAQSLKKRNGFGRIGKTRKNRVKFNKLIQNNNIILRKLRKKLSNAE